MDNSHRTQTASSGASFREAGLAELIKDVMRIGPAPNRSREAFVTVVNVAFVGAAVALLQPEAAALAILVGALVAFTAIRWIVGTAKWRER